MATATQIDPVQGIYERLDKQDAVLKGLLAMAEKPAHKEGISPEKWLQGQVENGNGIAMFGPRGNVSTKGRYRKKSYIGAVDRLDGKRGSFGEWLVHARHAGTHEHIDPASRAKSMEVLKHYGTQQWAYKTQGDVDIVEKTALAESSAITGGYTVLPTMFSEQLYEVAIEDSIVEPKARKQPLSTRQCTIPALDQTNQTFSPVAGQSNMLGGLVMTWTAEAATRKESEPQFRNVVLTAWEGSFYALASNTLLADNAVGLDNYLTQLFGRAVGWYTDYANIRGNGVGQPLGVQNAKAAIQVTRQSGSTFTYIDACNMYSKFFWIMRRDNLCWIVHPTVITQLLQMNDGSGTTAGTGRLVFQPWDMGAQAEVGAPEGAMSCGRLFNHPVYVSEKVPALGTTGDVGLYDFDTYCVAKRMDIEIAISTQVAFLQNSTAWRIVIRQDGQPLLGNFLTYADGSSTASPYVLLH